jgi:putative redox protein
MANTLQVQVKQAGAATSEATIRTHHVLVDRPEAKGGENRGPMGGELLLAALGGCFMSNLLAAIRARGVPIANVRTLVSGTLAESPSRFDAVEMLVSAECDDGDVLRKLVTISERSCIVANTLRGCLKLSVTVEGP